jgi:demethylmenaquinone methyltransferase/2-methoxy-6-polyprenyl-1,4-benzoquinol methylase
MGMAETRDPGRVQAMFGGIARRYDLLNHLLSANLDRRWRKKACNQLPDTPSTRLLDLCGGTGDLGLEAIGQGRAGVVICADFSLPMLKIGAEKFQNQGKSNVCHPLGADGLKLPFRDRSFDAVTVGFGIRNFSDMAVGLREIRRVLRPGGVLVVLEFSTPTAPVLSNLYRFYLNRLLPWIGNRISRKEGPYSYLAATISRFPDGAALSGIILDSGFETCEWQALTGGIVAIHRAQT